MDHTCSSDRGELEGPAGASRYLSFVTCLASLGIWRRVGERDPLATDEQPGLIGMDAQSAGSPIQSRT